MRDWRFFPMESDWNEARMKYTSDAHITQSYLELPLFQCPDLIIEAEDINARTDAYENVSENDAYKEYYSKKSFI